MKKSLIVFSAAMLIAGASFAQTATKPAAAPAPAAKPAAAPAPAQNPDANMKFTNEEHNFGNIPEGPAVSFDFEFKNVGREPIVLSGVQASCGCTTPTWTKDPVLPGKTGKITATYNTQGRPGNFVKTITVNSNVGTKVLKISGVVEKAPDSSVPANNNSMMKH
ncbi:MAG: DUF1573 domain-containing protein [Chitinophagaceae bacterium]|jgi:hypothetical protein|nr:DUF1573 domain-containing protein [Chitinophagaceae bacterium]